MDHEQQQNNNLKLPGISTTPGKLIPVSTGLQYNKPVQVVRYVNPATSGSSSAQIVRSTQTIPGTAAGVKRVIAVPCVGSNSSVKNVKLVPCSNAIIKKLIAVPCKTNPVPSNTSNTVVKKVIAVPCSAPNGVIKKVITNPVTGTPKAIIKSINGVPTSSPTNIVKTYRPSPKISPVALIKNVNNVSSVSPTSIGKSLRTPQIISPNAVIKNFNGVLSATSAASAKSVSASSITHPNAIIKNVNSLPNSNPSPTLFRSSGPGTRLTITGLMAATKRGDFDSIKKSIKNFGFPPNGTKTTDYVLLQTAILKKYYVIAKFYINSGCSVNDNSHGNNKHLTTPLYLAVEQKNEELVALLLQRGASLDIKNEVTGKTPLHLAAESKLFNILYRLLQYKCDVDICDKLGRTVLHILLMGLKNENKDPDKIFIEIIRKIMSKKPSVTSKYNNDSPLHLAASLKQKIILTLLLEGADNFNEKNFIGNTVLHSLLNVSHANVDQPNEQENLDIVKTLLSKGANVNIKNKNGQTPLHLCAKNKHFKILAYFLLFKIDVEVMDTFGKTVLFYLVDNFKTISQNHMSHYLTLIKTLVVKGAAVNNINRDSIDYLSNFHTKFKDILMILAEGKGAAVYRDSKGNSFLHIALLSNPVDAVLVKFLLKNNFQVDVRNSSGLTPIHLVAQKRNWDLLETFLKDGFFDVNASDDQGNTILHFVLENFNSSVDKHILELILSKGASTDLKNKRGHSPLFAASNAKCNDLILMLLHLSKDPSRVLDIRDDSKNSLLYLVLNNLYAAPDRYTLQTTCEIVKILMEKGAAIDSKNHVGEMPVHLVLKINKTALTEIILKMTTKANINGNDGTSIGCFLTVFLKSNNLSEVISKEPQVVDLIHLFLRNGSTVDDVLSRSSLINAITLNLKSLTEILLKHMDNFNSVDAAGNSILHIYLGKKVNGPEMIRQFIEKGVPLNAKNAEGQTPLHLAVKNIDFESSRTLLDFSADIGVLDDSGNNVVHTLLSTGVENSEFLEFLILRGADIQLRNKSGHTPLHVACERNFLNSCKILIDHGADAEAADSEGSTALHILGKFNLNENKSLKKGIVELLMSCHLDVDVPMNNGMTPLHVAAQEGELNVVDVLMNNGARLDRKDAAKGSTPLHLAAEENRGDMIELLLKDNLTDVNIRRNDRSTALHIAAHPDRINALKKLLECGADIDLRDKYGKTALHWACWYENVEGVTELLACCADINAFDNKGMVPLNYSVTSLEDMYPLFYKHGVLLQAAGFSVSDKLTKMLRNANVNMDDVHKLQNFCTNEVVQMKNICLDSTVHLFDLLRMNLNKLAIYINNETVQKILESDNLVKLFPYYEKLLKACYFKGIVRSKLAENARHSLNKLIKINIPVSCKEMIFSYLDNESLTNLIKTNDLHEEKWYETPRESNNNLFIKKVRLN